MTRAELRKRVQTEFGPKLRRLTPAGAREFLDRLYREFHTATHLGGPIEIKESAHSYEEIMADFFTSVLEVSAEDAAVMLWLWAFEQHYATLEEEYTERFLSLFEKPEIDNGRRG